MKALTWAVSTFTALAFAVVFAGALAMAATAHGAEERGRMTAELSTALIVAEEAQRAHFRADSLRVQTINGMVGPQ